MVEKPTEQMKLISQKLLLEYDALIMKLNIMVSFYNTAPELWNEERQKLYEQFLNNC